MDNEKEKEKKPEEDVLSKALDELKAAKAEKERMRKENLELLSRISTDGSEEEKKEELPNLSEIANKKKKVTNIEYIRMLANEDSMGVSDNLRKAAQKALKANDPVSAMKKALFGN